MALATDTVLFQVWSEELSEGDKIGRKFGLWITVSTHPRGEMEIVERRRNTYRPITEAGVMAPEKFKTRWAQMRGNRIVALA